MLQLVRCYIVLLSSETSDPCDAAFHQYSLTVFLLCNRLDFQVHPVCIADGLSGYCAVRVGWLIIRTVGSCFSAADRYLSNELLDAVSSQRVANEVVLRLYVV